MENNKNDNKFIKFTKLQIISLIILSSVIVSFGTGIIMAEVSNTNTELGRALNNFISKNKTRGAMISNNAAGVLSEENLIVNLVAKTNPAVVSVVASKDVPVVEQYYVNPFGNDGLNSLLPPDLLPDFQVPQYRQKGVEKKQISSGTGFFVSSDGLILTNKHVVEDPAADYTIIMNSGKKMTAKVIARDKFQDVAILKITGSDFSFIPLGDSDALKVGQTAIAIGNSLGEFQNTVSVGVISGLGRTIEASGGIGGPEKLQSVIQTDAAINPGNSGGPLLNTSGEAVGINTAVASGAQSIGFALPINFAKKDIEDVKKFSRIKTPFLGVRYSIVNADLQSKNGLSTDYGALIGKGQNNEAAISPNSPAMRAGLREGDIILQFDGKKVDNNNTLSELISKKSVGDKIILKVLRNGKQITLFLILDEMPS